MPRKLAQHRPPRNTTSYVDDVDVELEEGAELAPPTERASDVDVEVLSDEDMIESDGEPMETYWHVLAMYLLMDVVLWHFHNRDDFFVSGNMFIYYRLKGGRRQRFKGPDFFYVKDVPRFTDRQTWVVAEEGNRYPDVIIELLSPRTKKVDLGHKKDVYEKIFRTPEYYCYDNVKQQWRGWRLKHSKYVTINPNQRGWLWSDGLEMWLGAADGEYRGAQGHYPRFYDGRSGQMLPTAAEATRQSLDAERQRADAEKQQAEVEKQRADAEKHRADALAREMANLKAQLKQK